MSDTCARWKCENPRKGTHAMCEEHPPLKDHGLNANDTKCPECGEKGMGTIHDDLWYCLDEHGFDGCGELVDPYDLSDTPKEPRW